MDQIGPTFADELIAAGLNGLPFSWGSDGLHMTDPRLTDEQKDAIQAVLAAHNPLTPNRRDQQRDAFADGLRIVSTGTPGLNGTYFVQGDLWLAMKDMALYIAVFSAFPNSASTLGYPAMTGIVTFTTTAQFMAVVRAIGDWQSRWLAYIQGGALPTSPITIE